LKEHTTLEVRIKSFDLERGSNGKYSVLNKLTLKSKSMDINRD